MKSIITLLIGIFISVFSYGQGVKKFTNLDTIVPGVHPNYNQEVLEIGKGQLKDNSGLTRIDDKIYFYHQKYQGGEQNLCYFYNDSTYKIRNNYAATHDFSSNLMKPFKVNSKVYTTIRRGSDNINMIAEVSGDSLILVPGPRPSNPSDNMFGFSTVSNNKVYFIVAHNNIAFNPDSVFIYTFDGSNYVKFTEPSGYSLTVNTIEQTLNSFELNNETFAVLNTTSGLKYEIAKFTGTTLTLISNPSALDKGFMNFEYLVNQNKLYSPYVLSNFATTIGVFDGTTISVATRPVTSNATDGVKGAAGVDLINWNDTIYCNYLSGVFPTQTSQLARLVNDTIRLLGISEFTPSFAQVLGNQLIGKIETILGQPKLRVLNPGAANWASINYPTGSWMQTGFSNVLFKNNLYFIVDSVNAKHRIFKYDGSQISTIQDNNLYYTFGMNPPNPNNNNIPVWTKKNNLGPEGNFTVVGDYLAFSYNFHRAIGDNTIFDPFGGPPMTSFTIFNYYQIARIKDDCTAPAITSQPIATQICNGSSGSISVGYSGTVTTREWYKDGVIIPSATTSSLTYSNMTVADTGDYYFKGISPCGTIISDTVHVSMKNLPSITANDTSICQGISHTIIPLGGVSYTYSPGGSATVSPLITTDYIITGIGANSCVNKDTITITVLSVPAIAKDSTNVLCNGTSSGSIDLTVSGTSTPYTFDWGGGITDEDRTSLSASLYSCTVTGANDCAKTVTVNITQPSEITSAISAQTNVLCNGASTGAATVSVSGGISPYTYSWSPSGGNAATASGLSEGSYTCTITDFNECTKTQNATITQPATSVSGTTAITHVSCYDGSTGAINLSPSGGTAPYNFNWGGGITTEDRTGLSAGSYSVTITDANGCMASVSATLTEPTSSVSGTSATTHVSCYGGSNGEINLTATGGTAPYTFNWGGGITTEDRTDLSAGTYAVTITDTNGCTASVSTTITQPTDSISGTTAITHVSCNDGSNGEIDLTLTGGTAPYTFDWVGGFTTEDLTELSAGTYSVTITDSNSCTATVSATITEPASVLFATTSLTHVSCYDGSNGAINLTPSGGTAPYSFNWGGGITTEDRTGLSAGSYSVTITDSNECTFSVSATVTEPATSVSGTTAITHVSCNAGTNGAISLTPTGGTSPYTFDWGGGITTEDRTGLTAGEYSVVITDANGCTNTQNVTITQPTAITSTISSQTNVLCFGANTGAATVFASGGTGAFSYSWSPSGGTAATAAFLTAGTYTVTITDANACTKTQSATITQPLPLVVSVASNTNVSCNGAATGSMTSTVTGGVPSYSYLWSTGATTANISGLSAGSYTCYATDANGCTTNASSTISQPASLTGTAITTNVACFGGTTGAINLTPTGGTAPYTFNWGGGITTEDRTGLTAGTYSVTITDANECTGTASATITQPSSAISGSTVITNVSCNAGTNGAINLTATGGTSPYTFNWGGGITTEDRTGLTAGAYSVVITDANGCTATVSKTITQPAVSVSGTTAIINVSCNSGSNGAIYLTATGGTEPYTFNWGGGITTQNRTGLSAGTYAVTITDTNGCTTSVSATITQPAVSVSGTTAITHVSCYDGSNGAINLTPTGGSAPYFFNWGGGITTEDRTGLSAGTYVVTITDANECTATFSSTITQPAVSVSGTTAITHVSCNAGSNGAINLTPTGGTAPYTFNWGGGITTEDRTGLSAGTYSVTITDANECTGSVSATINQPAVALSGSTVISNVSCNAGTNGAINLTATGGTSPYTFNWGGGITTEDRTSLSAGTYSATITDANSCTATVSATITQPAAISGTTAITHVSCNAGSDGAINLTPAGGTAPYSYNWGGGITTQDRTGLSAGTYAVTITDTNGCTAVVSATVTQPTNALSGTKVVTNVSCNAGSNGAINITPTGGTAPYTFNWGGGITTEDRTGLSAGTYSVTITDANECTASVSATITEPSTALSGSKVITNVSCNSGSNGAINLTPAGGTAPYSYNWGGGITSEDRTGLIAGTYNVTITDANGCTASVSSTVTQPTAIGVAWIETPVNCFGESNGAIDLTASGGTAPYTFNWGGGITSEDRTALTAGSYNVTITDGNSCPGSFTINVTQPAILSSSKVITHANCYGSSNAAINITVTGGTSPYNYFWNSSFETEDLTGISAGTYSVQISDSHGCPLNDTAVVTQPSEIISSTVVSHVDCFGNATGAINIVPSGGVGPYTFNWGGGISTEDRSGLAAGTYALVITDATNCVGNVSTVVNQPTVLSATNTSENIACFGASTGSINVTAAGGTAPYSYNWGAQGTSEDLSNVPSGNYLVTVTDDHGCTTTSSATLSQPTEITFAKDSTNIFCFGDNSGMANVAVTGGVGPYAYTWIGTSAYTETANYLTAGNYSVEITDDNGCVKFADFALTQNPEITSSFSISQCDPFTWESNYYPSSGTYQQVFTAANGCDSTVTLNLTVFGYPSISINASETIICAGESITLDANGGISAATWDNGVINNEPFVPSETTIYTASVSNAQGCVSFGSVEVFVRELPNVMMENFADSTCLDADIVACPFATPAGGTYAGTGVIGVLLDTQEAGLGQHEVIYTVSDQYGCSNSDTSMINIVECELPYNETSLDENTEDLVSIYPNPSNGEFTIESDGNLNATITDAMGRIVQIVELKSGMTSVSIANEANGVYFIIIPAHASIYKIVKH